MSSYIEGKHALAEALSSHVPLQKILVGDKGSDKSLDSLVAKAHKLGIPVKKVSKQTLDSLSERRSHQGIVAEVAPFVYATLDEVLGQIDDKGATAALIVILDHITDAGNFGALIRSAVCAGASAIIIPDKRSVSVTAATYKTSAGAVAHIPIVQVTNLVRAIEKLKERGYWIAGATEKSSESLWGGSLQGSYGLVMGNEEKGISRLVQENCDELLRIPQASTLDSLNVAQAATVCMFEWLRQNLPSLESAAGNDIA